MTADPLIIVILPPEVVMKAFYCAALAAILTFFCLMRVPTFFSHISACCIQIRCGMNIFAAGMQSYPHIFVIRSSVKPEGARLISLELYLAVLIYTILLLIVIKSMQESSSIKIGFFLPRTLITSLILTQKGMIANPFSSTLHTP